MVATSSMLGIAMFTSISSCPFFKVDIVNMDQLSFWEFLEACNEEVLMNYLKAFKYAKLISKHGYEKRLEEFDKFIELGGYPEVISDTQLFII